MVIVYVLTSVRDFFILWNHIGLSSALEVHPSKISATVQNQPQQNAPKKPAEGKEKNNPRGFGAHCIKNFELKVQQQHSSNVTVRLGEFLLEAQQHIP